MRLALGRGMAKVTGKQTAESVRQLRPKRELGPDHFAPPALNVLLKPQTHHLGICNNRATAVPGDFTRGPLPATNRHCKQFKKLYENHNRILCGIILSRTGLVRKLRPECFLETSAKPTGNPRTWRSSQFDTCAQLRLRRNVCCKMASAPKPNLPVMILAHVLGQCEADTGR